MNKHPPPNLDKQAQRCMVWDLVYPWPPLVERVSRLCLRLNFLYSLGQCALTFSNHVAKMHFVYQVVCENSKEIML